MNDELELYQSAAEEQMQAAVAHLDDTLQHIRAGKANPRILDPIKIDYYGTLSPLSSCATVTTPDARTIAITPWEKKLINDIERAIINSNIGLAPSNNGETIRLILPPLTEERRRELGKQRADLVRRQIRRFPHSRHALRGQVFRHTGIKIRVSVAD